MIDIFTITYEKQYIVLHIVACGMVQLMKLWLWGNGVREAPRVVIGNENKCGIALGPLHYPKACHSVKQCYPCKSILVLVAEQ